MEAWDCTVYAVWLETHLELGKKPAKWWDILEAEVQPVIGDLFSTPAPTAAPEQVKQPEKMAQQEAKKLVAVPAAPPSRSGGNPFASDEWSSRGF